MGTCPLPNAIQVLVRANEESSARHSHRGLTGVSQRIPGEDLEVHSRGNHHGFTGLGQAVDAAIGIDWRGSVALLTGFVAKEIVVSTMGVLYAAGEDHAEEGEALQQALKDAGITPLSAYALMAFLGKEVFSLMEKVTALDLASPHMKTPFLLQGPVLHVRCQIVVSGEKGDDAAVLIACSGGYGQSMCEALLDAGMEWGFRPAGESAFRDWLEQG